MNMARAEAGNQPCPSFLCLDDAKQPEVWKLLKVAGSVQTDRAIGSSVPNRLSFNREHEHWKVAQLYKCLRYDAIQQQFGVLF